MAISASGVTGPVRMRWSHARACRRLASTCMNPESRSMTASRTRAWGRWQEVSAGWSLRSANICRALYRAEGTEPPRAQRRSHDIYAEIAALLRLADREHQAVGDQGEDG